MFELTEDQIVSSRQNNPIFYIFDYYQMIDGPRERHLGQSAWVKQYWRSHYVYN